MRKLKPKKSRNACTINLQRSQSFLVASRRQHVCSLFTSRENANSFAPLWKPRLNRTEDQYTRSTILGPRESNFDEEIPTFVEIIFLNQGLCQTINFFTRGLLWDIHTFRNYSKLLWSRQRKSKKMGIKFICIIGTLPTRNLALLK